MKPWLVRRPDLSIERPLSQPELVDKIESGLIKAADEICIAGGYWFSIQEIDEVKKHFGEIHLKALLPGGSEITSTTLNLTALQTEAKVKAPALPKSTFVNTLAVPSSNRTTDPAVDAALSRRAQAMGWLLVLIFFGTLGLLWWGSQ